MNNEQTSATMFYLNNEDKISPATILFCQQKNQSKFSCHNKNCQKYPFVCQNSKCDCRKDHKKCMIVLTETIFDSLTDKIVGLLPLQTCIEKGFEKIIDELSDIKKNLLIRIKKNFQCNMLSKDQADFLLKLKQGQVQKITGSQLWKIQNQSDQDKELPMAKQMKASAEQLNKIFLRMHDSLHEPWNQIEAIPQNQLSSDQEAKNIVKKQSESNLIIGSDKSLLISASSQVSEQKQLELIKLQMKSLNQQHAHQNQDMSKQINRLKSQIEEIKNQSQCMLSKSKEKFESMLSKENDNFLMEIQRVKQKYEQQVQQMRLKIISLEQERMKLIIQTVIEQKPTKTQFFIESKIVAGQKDLMNLVQFLKPKEVKSMKLLYRASENGFLVSKFHQKCDNMAHTLILLKTQFNKIIGGYTPLTWKNSNNLEYVKDQSGQSFIFSLTNNHKFTPKRKQSYDIVRQKLLGPIFGGGGGYGYADLFIDDKANQNNKSYANINYSYINSHYKFNDKPSKQRFSGNPNLQSDDSWNKFRILQWQVYLLQLM